MNPLSKFRRRYTLTQIAFARRLGVSRATLWLWERDPAARPSDLVQRMRSAVADLQPGTLPYTEPFTPSSYERLFTSGQVRACRLYLGMSVKQMSLLFSVSPKTWRGWEQGWSCMSLKNEVILLKAIGMYKTFDPSPSISSISSRGLDDMLRNCGGSKTLRALATALRLPTYEVDKWVWSGSGVPYAYVEQVKTLFEEYVP